MASVFNEYSKEYGPIKAIFIFVYKIIRRTITNLYASVVRKIGKLDNNAIVFTSLPDYSDNSRALSEYLESSGRADKYKIYWLVYDVDKCKKLYPDTKVEFIPRFANKFKEFPLSSVKKCLTAKYLIATHEFEFPKSKAIKGQKYIRLWHGCGYKDNETSLVGSDIFDVHLVPGELFVGTKSHFWHCGKEYFLPTGLPRFDWLINKTDSASDLYNDIKGDNNKVIIWMPTFRNAKRGNHTEGSISQFPLMQSKEQWFDLDRCCKESKVVLLVKLHIFQKDYDIPFDEFTNIKEISNADFDNAGVKMYEFLAFTDGLISDYSSIAIDYLLVDKPIAFALDDFELYKSARGFVFDNPKEYMPGHHLYNEKDLEKFILEVAEGSDTFKTKRDEMSKIAINHSSNYCKHIADILSL